MEKIKSRIEKLLRLSLSNSPHEANVAALKAVELMEKYALTRADISTQKIISYSIRLEYYRLPRWLSSLFTQIGHMNGCYVVWVNGSEALSERSKIVLTGLESDIVNIEYYMAVYQAEIEKKVNIFKKQQSSTREDVKSYRIGLVEGIVATLYKASQTFNASLLPNALVPIDQRYEEAKENYLSNHNVKIMPALEVSVKYFRQGRMDSRGIDISRPMENQNKIQVVIENKSSN